jgi:hypothetical protein
MIAPSPGARAPHAMPPDWTMRIAELAPALRACLADAGPAAFATDPAPGPEGLRVMIRGRDGAFACILRDGAAPAHVPLPGQAAPDPAAPAFFLERRCVDARRVDAPDGTVLGWLAYPAC